MNQLDDKQYVELGIGLEKYALPIQEIFEIIKMQTVTTIPNSQPHMLGVINLRGHIVPVISTRYAFGLGEVEPCKTTRIVIIRNGDDMAGIVVDSVYRIVTLTDMQPAPEDMVTRNSSLLAGIGETSDGFLGVLRLDPLLRAGSAESFVL